MAQHNHGAKNHHILFQGITNKNSTTTTKLGQSNSLSWLSSVTYWVLGLHWSNNNKTESKQVKKILFLFTWTQQTDQKHNIKLFNVMTLLGLIQGPTEMWRCCNLGDKKPLTVGQNEPMSWVWLVKFKVLIIKAKSTQHPKFLLLLITVLRLWMRCCRLHNLLLSPHLVYNSTVFPVSSVFGFRPQQGTFSVPSQVFYQNSVREECVPWFRLQEPVVQLPVPG